MAANTGEDVDARAVRGQGVLQIGFAVLYGAALFVRGVWDLDLDLLVAFLVAVAALVLVVKFGAGLPVGVGTAFDRTRVGRVHRVTTIGFLAVLVVSQALHSTLVGVVWFWAFLAVAVAAAGVAVGVWTLRQVPGTGADG
jgi:hypothetical protein